MHNYAIRVYLSYITISKIFEDSINLRACAYTCFGYALAYNSAPSVAIIVAMLCVAIAYCTILCGRDGFATCDRERERQYMYINGRVLERARSRLLTTYHANNFISLSR